MYRNKVVCVKPDVHSFVVFEKSMYKVMMIAPPADCVGKIGI